MAIHGTTGTFKCGINIFLTVLNQIKVKLEHTVKVNSCGKFLFSFFLMSWYITPDAGADPEILKKENSKSKIR